MLNLINNCIYLLELVNAEKYDIDIIQKISWLKSERDRISGSELELKSEMDTLIYRLKAKNIIKYIVDNESFYVAVEDKTRYGNIISNYENVHKNKVERNKCPERDLF